MHIPSYTSFKAVIESTNRVPYTHSDGDAIRVFLRRAALSNRDIRIHPGMGGSVRELMADGLLMLTSDNLDADIVFVKINGGKGFFGRQKSRVMSYVGKLEGEALMPGAAFSGILMALTSINNIYREVESHL